MPRSRVSGEEEDDEEEEGEGSLLRVGLRMWSRERLIITESEEGR